MFLRRWEGKRRCRFLPFTFRETNDSQFLLKVVMGPDLDLNKDEVEMVVLKRLWPCPAGTDLAGGGFRDSISTTNVYKTIPVLYYLDKKLRIICSPFGVIIDSGWNCTP